MSIVYNKVLLSGSNVFRTDSEEICCAEGNRLDLEEFFKDIVKNKRP